MTPPSVLTWTSIKPLTVLAKKSGFMVILVIEELGGKVVGISVIYNELKQRDVEFLKKYNVKVEPFSKDVVRDENACTNCIGICPTNALCIPDRKNMKVEYSSEKCIACEACVEACPFHAISVKI